MNNNFKKNMADMFSLMERMEKNLTLSESELLKENFINEATTAQGNFKPHSGLLKPNADIKISEDKAKRVRQVIVTISPVRQQDANKIIRSGRYMGDNNIQVFPNKKYQGFSNISIKKELPLAKSAEARDDKKASQASAAQAGATAQQQPAPKGLAGMLKAKKAVNEGLMNMLKSKQQAQQAQNQQQPQTMSQAPQSAPSDPSDDVKSTSVYKWLKSYYLPIVNMLESTGAYDNTAIDRLKDIDELYSAYAGTTTEDENVYISQTADEIKNKISEAIANGNWASYIQSNINPINVDSLIFGHVLSALNRTRISNVKASLGLQGNVHNLILGPRAWRKFFKRRIVDNPSARYPLVGPKADIESTLEKGTNGHNLSMGKQTGGYVHYVGYAYEDTEPIDPNDTTDYLNDIPGILNNSTGELNQKAIDAKEQALLAKQANLTDEEIEQINNLGTDEGKAELFNEGLSAVIQRAGGSGVVPIDGTGNPVHTYVENIMRAVRSIVSKTQPRQDICDIQTAIISFGIGCFTIGSDEILKYASSKGYTNPSRISVDWKEQSDNIIQNLRAFIDGILTYCDIKFKAIREKIVNSAQSQTQAQQPQPQTVASTVNESINKIESLLFDF